MLNAYQTLMIANCAQEAEIKNAYYHLSKIYHPDGKNPDLEKFNLIEKAYSILTNPHLKKQHDFYWKITCDQEQPNSKEQSLITIDQNKSLNNQNNINHQVRDLVINYEISFLDYWCGTNLVINYWTVSACKNQECIQAIGNCNQCQGLGYFFENQSLPKPCQTCQATGINTEINHQCQNRVDHKTLIIKILPGGLKNLQMVFTNQGHQSRNLKTKGNLVINLKIKKVEGWSIKDGICLLNLTLPISFYLQLETLKVLSPWKEILNLNLQSLKTSTQRIQIQGKKLLMKPWLNDFNQTLVWTKPFYFEIAIVWQLKRQKQFENDYQHYLKNLMLKLNQNDK